jgi:hypothetical protein
MTAWFSHSGAFAWENATPVVTTKIAKTKKPAKHFIDEF